MIKPCELLRFVVQESASLNQHPFNVSHKPVEVFVAKLMGDNLRQSGPSMAAIDGPAGPSMATKSAIDGPAGPVVAGDHLRRDRPPLQLCQLSQHKHIIPAITGIFKII